ncbi:hypothetical protein KY289_023310 [Solanum tuberosum]|nr:hypothetical protein KY289_023310 [Solanum tuberosum]
MQPRGEGGILHLSILTTRHIRGRFTVDKADIQAYRTKRSMTLIADTTVGSVILRKLNLAELIV